MHGLVALHIPDAFLSLPVSLAGWAIAAVLLSFAVRQSRSQFQDKQVPLMGVLAAFVFAAQAINFPILGGTSGHVVGAALSGILAGPWAGTLIMSAVVIVQALMFQDGGILVMGCNMLNLGAFAVFAGYASFVVAKKLVRRTAPAAFLAAWLSVEVAAVATALQLGASGTIPLTLALPALTGVYGLVGLGEGVITAVALGLLESNHPEIVQGMNRVPARGLASVVTVVLASALLLALLSPWASSAPDGLEAVAEKAGMGGLAPAPLLEVFPGYSVFFLDHSVYSTIVAMVIGAVAVLGLVLALGHFATRVED